MAGASAAVVGAAGFIGGHLAARLRTAGIPVYAFSRSRLPCTGSDPADCFREVRTVFYLATSVNPSRAEARPDLVAADHATFARLLDGLEVHSWRPTVVLTSSGGSVYTPSGAPPYSEASEVGPTSGYGKAKLRLEAELSARSRTLPSVILRLANVYGPGQRAGTGQGVIAHWLGAAERGTPLQVFGDPSRVRDYVYVDDVVDAMLGIHRRLILGQAPTADGARAAVVNLGSGIGTPLWRVLELVLTTIGGRGTVEFVPARPFDERDVWLDVTYASQALGWTPRTTLEHGLHLTWERLREEPAAGRSRS